MSAKPDTAVSSKFRGKALLTAVSALLVIILLAIAVRKNSAPEDNIPVQTAFPVMGTIGRVAIYAGEKELTTATDIYRREFDAVSAVFSLRDQESELFRLNSSAAEKPFPCSETMWFLLMRAKQAYEETAGAFDITVKPLMDLWGFYQQKKRTDPPSAAEIAAVLEKTGFDKLQFNEAEKTVFFTVPGMALDFGGIAKGYAADRAAQAVAAAGITAGVIDIGGNLRMLPDAPGGKEGFIVAIRDPKDRNSVLPEMLTVKPAMAVSTSGNYERFIELNGKKYSHIISPATGYPAEISAVTVVAPTALDADIFSTACVAGGEKTAGLLRQKYPELQIYFMR